MRYSPEHKEQTRERIVHAASRRFRRAGAGVGIGQLMKTLKMTHGGFYRHFRSKDELLIEALDQSFTEMQDRRAAMLRRAKPGHELEALVEGYLSEAHCADAAGGCAVAALASEISRQPRAVRAAFDQMIQRGWSMLAPFMPGDTEEERRRRAGVLMSAMSGTLAVARAISDDRLRRSFLSAARKTYIEVFASR
jgi:TetR/AcrR family transcriptional regulator, transcriptional repressor for nem operon